MISRLPRSNRENAYAAIAIGAASISERHDPGKRSRSRYAAAKTGTLPAAQRIEYQFLVKPIRAMWSNVSASMQNNAPA